MLAALPQQTDGTICLSCTNTAARSSTDAEERRLLADFELCRSEELAIASQLSSQRLNPFDATYRELVDTLHATRLRCDQKLLACKVYRKKRVDRVRI